MPELRQGEHGTEINIAGIGWTDCQIMMDGTIMYWGRDKWTEYDPKQSTCPGCSD